MAWLFRKAEKERQEAASAPSQRPARPLYQTILFFGFMVGILIFANWSRPETSNGIWYLLYRWKWIVTSLLAAGLGIVLAAWFSVRRGNSLRLAWRWPASPGWYPHAPEFAFLAGIVGLAFATASAGEEMSEWLDSTWTFTKQILPLLLIGVLIAGLALGSPGT